MISRDDESRSKTGEILMSRVTLKQLIEAGAHFGHLTSRWNPKMKPYIFMEKNGIHIIDLKKTINLLDRAADALYNIVAQGKGVLFVGTKKQAKTVIASEARRANSNWVSERWLGGMLTNFHERLFVPPNLFTIKHKCWFVFMNIDNTVYNIIYGGVEDLLKIIIK
jgi:ribosomal protein S2